MMRRASTAGDRGRRWLPSPTFVVALLALVMATAGTSYGQDAYSAAKKLITGKQIKQRAITARHSRRARCADRTVKNGSLLAKDFKPGQLPAGSARPGGSAGSGGSGRPAGKDLRRCVRATTRLT